MSIIHPVKPVYMTYIISTQVIFFVSGPKFAKLFSLNAEKIVVDNTIFHLSIA